MWFANGIHHHYSNDKFRPEFSESFFREAAASVGMDRFPADFDFLCKVIFDPAIYPTRLNQAAGADMLWTSASNYYSNVRQHEAEQFYAAMAAADAGDPCPVSYGLNSQLVKEEKTGRLYERTWKVGGMYSPAIERIVYWLEKARDVAAEPQKQTLAALIDYYRTGDLKQFDRYNILWLQDTVSNVDFVNGFIETYGDPLGYKASWEANVNARGSSPRTPSGSKTTRPSTPPTRKRSSRASRPRSSPWRCSAATATPPRRSESTFRTPTGSARSTARNR